MQWLGGIGTDIGTDAQDSFEYNVKIILSQEALKYSWYLLVDLSLVFKSRTIAKF